MSVCPCMGAQDPALKFAGGVIQALSSSHAVAPPSGTPLCARVRSVCVCSQLTIEWEAGSGDLAGEEDGLRKCCAGIPGAFTEEVARELIVPRLRLPLDASRPQRPPLPLAPGMFCSTPARLPKGRPLGAATAPPPLPGRPLRRGQDAWVPAPLPSQREIPPRSPQALGSQNNPAGEGRLWRKGSGRGAEQCCWVLQVPLGRGLEKRAYQGLG